MKKRMLALALAAALLTGCAAESAAAVETVADAPEAQSETPAETTAAPRTTTDGVDKQETVYAKATAAGSVTETTVEVVLKARDGDTIEDQSTLRDIKNTEGDEEYTQGADGALTWQNAGAAIHYEGKTDAALPVSVQVHYYLDGQELAPAKLAGQSGHLRIRFDYQNTTAETVTVEGQQVTVCVPFTAMTALVLDNEKFTNIEADNGTVMDLDGSTAVVGFALPGLADSLCLTDYEPLADTEIPAYFEVEADVVDFSLDFTATILTADTLNDADLDDLDDIDDLSDAMDELTDATDELADGAGALADGIMELYNGFDQYAQGVEGVNTGAESLADALDELYKNADKLTSGAQAINAGVATVDDALAQVDLSALGDSDTLAQQAAQMQQAGAALENSTGDALTGAAQIGAGAALQAMLTDASLWQDSGLTAEQLQTLQGLLAQKAETYTAAAAQAIQTEMQTPESALGSYAQAAVGGGQALQKAGALVEQAAPMLPQLAQLQSGIAELHTGTEQLYRGLETYAAAMRQVSAGANELATGSAELDDASDAMYEGIATLYNGACEMRDGVQEFSDEGVDDLTDLTGDGLQNVVRRLRAAQQAGQSYQTFTGLAANQTGSVRFIIETDEIA